MNLGSTEGEIYPACFGFIQSHKSLVWGMILLRPSSNSIPRLAWEALNGEGSQGNSSKHSQEGPGGKSVQTTPLLGNPEEKEGYFLLSKNKSVAIQKQPFPTPQKRGSVFGQSSQNSPRPMISPIPPPPKNLAPSGFGGPLLADPSSPRSGGWSQTPVNHEKKTSKLPPSGRTHLQQ